MRHAFNLAFDFEWANKNLFYDQYTRVGSYFDNSELKATGLPQGRELEILNELKDEVPPEVFTKEWKNPVNADARGYAQASGEAAKLLARSRLDAEGWRAHQCPRRAAHGRVSAGAARLRAHRAALQGGAGEARRQGERAHRRHLAVSAPAGHLRLRHHRCQLSGSRSRPATSSATSGARMPPARRAAATSSASRTRPSTS